MAITFQDLRSFPIKTALINYLWLNFFFSNTFPLSPRATRWSKNRRPPHSSSRDIRSFQGVTHAGPGLENFLCEGETHNA